MINDEEVETTMDVLVDELLVEILCRLPCHKIAFTCKAVCKRWATLISRPYFIRRFVAHKLCKMKNDGTFGLVVRKLDVTLTAERFLNENTWKGLMIRFNDPIYDHHNNVSVSSLPWWSNLPVVGASNDLLLYSKYEHCLSYPIIELYIFTTQTQRFIELPSLHLQGSASHIGFICDPYYSSNATTNVTLNDAYCACIFVILTPRRRVSESCFLITETTEFSARLLSPNTGGIWRNIVLSLPLSCQPVYFNSNFTIGRKYYFRHDQAILGFDPFVEDCSGDDVVIKCDSIPLPQPHMSPISTFGVLNKCLYMCEVGKVNSGTYRVWALEDYETGGCWSLRSTITAQDWIPRHPCLNELIDRDQHIGKPISFHPANPDLIYMLSHYWIILCNLETKEIEIVSELPQGFHDFYPDACPFQITLPLWPSPLPVLAL